ncbi:MAG: type II toxin-antitoxin system HipA family toxin [Candidatus Symbiothrix sp.]|jgi:serine/threonine-protein kinase HipA|nr:type II toxin-antitoxin system HipA family toxin [Candidatus Symbiothrix sp.]
METVLKVVLWGKDVAAVVWDKARTCATLEFYDSFVNERLNVAPLAMPLHDIVRGDKVFTFPSLSEKTFKGLPGLLADSLPDDYGNKILDEWFASQGLSFAEFTPIDRLCYVGKRGMGALEYEPANKDTALNESAKIEIEQLTTLAREVLNQREAFCADLLKDDKPVLDILKVGTSAGGAKPKAIIAINEQTGEIRSGQVKAPDGFTYWLLKFDGVEDHKLRDNPLGIGRIEYAYYQMATDCGIEMTDSKLLVEGDYAHFMTKRFDRTDLGEKRHTQTLCAIAHFDRDDRHSYEQAFQVMRQLHLPYPEMEQMYRRMVFNVIARNHDDHTKNHSFIMSKTGEWSLAPAYDLCYSYSPSGKWTNQHQLSLNNKRDNFTQEDLLSVAKNMDIKNASAIVQQVTEVVAHWETYAQKADVKKEAIQQIKATLRLF